MIRDDDPAPLIRYLGKPLYLFAALLIAFAVLDFVLNTWPLQLRTLAWRYAGEGLFSGSVLTIALGLFLINGLGLLGRNYRALKVAMLLEVGFAVVYLVFAVDFAISAWQLRDTAVSDLQVQLVFDVGGGKVTLKYLATAWLQLLAAMGSLRWTRDNPPPLEVPGGRKRPWWLFWWPDPTPPRPSNVGTGVPPRRSR